MGSTRKDRMPLTARPVQGLLLRVRMAPSKQRTYGKQGSSAASRALLRDSFVDENVVEEELASLSLEPPVVPEACNASTTGLEKKREETESRAAFLGRVKEHQRASKVDPAVAEAAKYVAPLLAEGSTSKALVGFEAWGDRLGKTFALEKIAEGSFGEVYKLQPRKVGGALKASTLDDYGGCILKVIPLNAQSGRGSRKYSAIPLVLREVQLLKKMDEIAGFARFREVHVVHGKYPLAFTEAFRDYKEEGKDCQNPDPTVNFSKTQLFAIIEMDDAGVDLETLTSPSAFQVHDVFWSVVIILANAEEQVEFEHRDLHVGNICIKPWAAGGSINTLPEFTSTMAAVPKPLLGRSGIRTTIIDYTLSRATVSKANAEIVYDPMKDASLFTAEGNEVEEKYQYECYRQMRTCVNMAEQSALEADPKLKESAVDAWSRFVPQTNVLWLSYILRVLLHRAKDRILKNSSVVSKRLQKEMYADLAVVSSSLDKADPTLLPSSARSLLNMAGENGWLKEEDVRLFKVMLEEEA